MLDTGEVPEVSPDVRLHRSQEAFEGCLVAVRRFGREAVEVAHIASVPGLFGFGELFGVARPFIGMECALIRELLSAVIDGEASPDEAELGATHVATCAACRGWFDVVGGSAARFRIGASEPVPDLVPMVLGRARTYSPGRWNWVRWALGLVAAVEFGAALPSVLVGAVGGHDSRHVGSFGAALAVGLLFVAWRPVRAYGVLPITVAAAAMMAVSAIVDVAAGRASAFGELHHVIEFVGLWLVWVLAGQPVPARLEPVLRRSVVA